MSNKQMGSLYFGRLSPQIKALFTIQVDWLNQKHTQLLYKASQTQAIWLWFLKCPSILPSWVSIVLMVFGQSFQKLIPGSLVDTLSGAQWQLNTLKTTSLTSTD